LVQYLPNLLRSQEDCRLLAKVPSRGRSDRSPGDTQARAKRLGKRVTTPIVRRIASRQLRPCQKANRQKRLSIIVLQLDATVLGTQGIAVRLVPICIRNQETKVLIDSGASGNFVSKEEATRLGLRMVRIVPIEASRADREAFQGQARDITYSILLETIMIGTYQEVVTFYILYKSAVPIILGRSWLGKHEPTIDWKTFQPTFNKCCCYYSEAYTEIEFGPMLR
jgi:hypothetical protein